MKKETVLKWLTGLAVVLGSIQLLVPTMPVQDPSTLKWVSAILLFLTAGVTIWKQYLSDLISNSAATVTWVIAGLATIGALNELVDQVEINNAVAQWVRFGVTALTVVLNIYSKLLFPSQEQKAIVAAKAMQP